MALALGIDSSKVPDASLTPNEESDESSDAELDGPREVGPYRVLRKIGEGGMGIVYLADQQAPIRRRVALKLIKLGMDTRQVIARFESERQALALMHHPHVAAVYDAGAAPDGRPYFVMEYVAGVSITEYCDRNRLDIPDRLRLFAQACEAIQHAHQKGIIHRDIKPGNVLVALADGAATVKVIDFGVAKATTARLTERTMFTQHGIVIGTPAYMSPEQADPFNADVDSRTDVYSLGVLLYELAAGALPFDTAGLLNAAHDEIRRRIREEDPPRPSTRISSLGDASIETARKRRTDPRKLQTELRGDLDWIVMRALDKDPARRYQSPSEFASDVNRYLQHQPVDARPPHALYRFRKLVRRHRLGVVAASLVLVSLTVGGAVATWQAIRAIRAERETRREADTVREVATFLQSLFEGADPTVARGQSVTARELLDRGRQRIERELSAQPEVRARLLSLLGDIYRKIGLYSEGEALLKDALATREQLHGPINRDVAEASYLLGRVTLDRGDYKGAEPMFARARQILEALPPADRDPGLLASAIAEQAQIAQHFAAYDRADGLYRESLEIRERTFGPSHADVAWSLNGIGGVAYDRGDFVKAEEAYRRALAIQRAMLGDDSPDVALTLSHLASALGRVGRDSEAEPMMVEAVRIQERAFGPVHAEVASALNNLASLYGRQGRLDKAAELLERTVAIRTQLFGPTHNNVAIAYRNLGLTYSLAGDYARADADLRHALELDEKNLGPTHTAVIWDLNTLGSLERKRAHIDESARLFSTARERAEQSIGTKHPEYERALEGLAGVALGRNPLDEAERLYAQALEIQQAAYGDNHFNTVNPVEGLGYVYVARGQGAQAIDYLQRGIKLREPAQGVNHPALSQPLRSLAAAYQIAGRSVDAEQALVRAMTIVEKAHGPDHPEVAASAQALGELFAARGDTEAAREQFTRALTIRRKVLGDAHPDTQTSAAALKKL
jgi:serine/threonine protein kinase/Tfp pilus assembly protein PilF